VCAYLAAVYLVWDSRRFEDDEMVEYFRRRAIVAGLVAGVIAFVGIFVLHNDARYVFDGLTSRALPFVIVSALCGAGSLVLLMRNTRGARALSIGAVATVVIGWGVAQWPYMLPTSLKVSQAAAPDATLKAVLVVFAIAAVTIVPALILLFVLDQKSVLPEEGDDERTLASEQVPAPGPLPGI
jgi:cytochrome d ubiquinol oxidase subunit II